MYYPFKLSQNWKVKISIAILSELLALCTLWQGSPVRSHQELDTCPGINFSAHNIKPWGRNTLWQWPPTRYLGSIFLYWAPVSGGGGVTNNRSIKGTTLEIRACAFVCYPCFMIMKGKNQSINQSMALYNYVLVLSYFILNLYSKRDNY